MAKDQIADERVLIGVRVPPELAEKIKKMAEKEQRKPANMAYVLLETHPRIQGFNLEQNRN